jgi:hypothetical protein
MLSGLFTVAVQQKYKKKEAVLTASFSVAFLIPLSSYPR